MRILLLTHAFNSLTQRLYLELARAGHTLSVEFDIHDAVTEEAVCLFQPELVVAPYLRRKIPERAWQRCPCFVLHPGPVGDRGPAALDWAILERAPAWGVTVLQANAEFDAGPIWASERFPMRFAAKSSLYRREVTHAAVAALRVALARFERGGFAPQPLSDALSGKPANFRPAVARELREIDWSRDSSEAALRKLYSADSTPGATASLCGRRFHLFGATADREQGGEPGELLARTGDAVCVATRDGSIWLSHLSEPRARRGFSALKLGAARLLGSGALAGVPERAASPCAPSERAICYREEGPVGSLEFEFRNGAMGCRASEALRAALERAKRRPTRVIVLWGGSEFWSNGIDLCEIEAAESPAEHSLQNILALNAFVRAVLDCDSQLVIAALRGNAGAGGVFAALAADRVLARSGIVLNPHYKNMGNLYGSEYWTYSVPNRVPAALRDELALLRLPIGCAQALRYRLIDEALPEEPTEFARAVMASAHALAQPAEFDRALREKAERRARATAVRSLDACVEAELEGMKESFFGFDPSYHVARYNFVHKVPLGRTPLHLARHRRADVHAARAPAATPAAAKE